MSQEDKDKKGSMEMRENHRLAQKNKRKRVRRERKCSCETDGVSHPVFGKQQIDGGISNDVHTELKGLYLPQLSRLCNLCHFHGLKVSR